MTIEVVPYAGWRKCVRLANREVELIVTTQVGPRVIRAGFIGGPNEFHQYQLETGQSGGRQFLLYGGHRLWVAPEQKPRTYHPDNGAVTWTESKATVSFKARTESSTGLQKEIRIALDPRENRAHLEHRITNHNPFAVTLAAWAVSIMAPGGRALLPHEPYHPHPARLAPARPLVLWPYTDMTDARWTWGSRLIQLRQDVSARGAQKIGAFTSLGWLAHLHGDRLFLKRFTPAPDVPHADFGCNVEIFTDEQMLELETLSPLKELQPGDAVVHTEEWHLFRRVDIGRRDADIEAQLAPYLEMTRPKKGS